MDSVEDKVLRAYKLSQRQPCVKHLKQLPHANQERYYWFLHYLASILQPKVIVECGVYEGTSLAHLAAGCMDAKVVGVDLNVEQIDGTLTTYPNVQVVRGNSLDYLKNYWGRPIELLFLDTEHTPIHVSKELMLAWPHLPVHGVVCIDDISISPQMETWWSGLKLNKYSFPDLHSTGFGVIIHGR